MINNHCHHRLYILGIIIFMGLLYASRAILAHTWMYVGLGSASMLTLYILHLPREKWHCIHIACFMALIVYQFHQFEEHGIDLLGRFYAFGPYVNHTISGLVGCAADAKDCPLTLENIFYINTLIIWLPLLIAACVIQKRPVVAACFVAFIPMNALAHIIVGLINHEYNPGLFTAITLFLPFSFYFYRKMLKEKYLRRCQLGLSLLYGLLGHPFIMLTLISAYVDHVYPTTLYPLVLLIYVALPLLISYARHGCCCIGHCDTGCKIGDNKDCKAPCITSCETRCEESCDPQDSPKPKKAKPKTTRTKPKKT